MYVNPGFTSHIEGLSKQESGACAVSCDAQWSHATLLAPQRALSLLTRVLRRGAPADSLLSFIYGEFNARVEFQVRPWREWDAAPFTCTRREAQQSCMP